MRQDNPQRANYKADWNQSSVRRRSQAVLSWSRSVGRRQSPRPRKTLNGPMSHYFMFYNTRRGSSQCHRGSTSIPCAGNSIHSATLLLNNYFAAYAIVAMKVSHSSGSLLSSHLISHDYSGCPRNESQCDKTVPSHFVA